MSRKAPNFRLEDQEGVIRKLSDYAGSWLVIFFYPSDRSINCNREVCAFRDEHNVIAQFGNAKVIGINKGTVSSHKRLADKHKLGFPLLSDPTHQVTEAFGAWRTKAASIPIDKAWPTRRNTYIINPEGEIVKEFLGVSIKNRVMDHVMDVINELQSLQNLVAAT